MVEGWGHGTMGLGLWALRPLWGQRAMDGERSEWAERAGAVEQAACTGALKTQFRAYGRRLGHGTMEVGAGAMKPWGQSERVGMYWSPKKSAWILW